MHVMSGAAEVPRPPDDPETRNIIDKLAQFVAKNGPDFENMTKQKQKGNPKFAFLVGGEFFHYYQYKVAAEQAVLRKQKMQAEQTLTALQSQIDSLQKQIFESEKNLRAQRDVLQQQQQYDVEETVFSTEKEHTSRDAAQLGLNLAEFDTVLNSLRDSCSQDSIANSKAWIIAHAHSDQHAKLIVGFLVRKIREAGGTNFNFRLHILYLANDFLHHFQKKPIEHLEKALADRLAEMFGVVWQSSVADGGQKEKLEKLVHLWESKEYLAIDVLQNLKDPLQYMQAWTDRLAAENATTVTGVAARLHAQYAQYERQHDQFVRHVEQQIASLNSECQQAMTRQSIQNIADQAQAHAFAQAQQAGVPPIATPGAAGSAPTRRSRFDIVGGPPAAVQQQVGIHPPPHPMQQPPPMSTAFLSRPPPLLGQPPPSQQGLPPWHSNMGQIPPPAQFGGNFPPQQASGMHGPLPPFGAQVPPPQSMVGMLRPPPPVGCRPGLLPAPAQIPSLMSLAAVAPPRAMFMHGMLEQPALVPTVAYYDLPAGLMAPLVALEDCEYKPLDPNDIRLPPPVPPSERLLSAVEAFYAPPNHENPRDSDGWEKLGLYEYYKAKEDACRDRRAELRKLAAEVKEVKSTNHTSSPPARRSRSRSLSPQTRRSREHRSRSRSRSRSPPERKRRSRSRSISPPHFGFAGSGDRRLDESNKGHQLLAKMGWSGRGLGVDEQGREEPVPAGEIREKRDLYKGIGVQRDAFEQFRRAKAGQYTQLLRGTKGEAAQ